MRQTPPLGPSPPTGSSEVGTRGGAAVECGDQCSGSCLTPLFRFAGEDLPPSTWSGLRFGGREHVLGSGVWSLLCRSPRCPDSSRGGKPSAPSTAYSGFLWARKRPRDRVFYPPSFRDPGFSWKRGNENTNMVSAGRSAQPPPAQGKHAPGVLGPSDRSPGQGWGVPHLPSLSFRIVGGHRAQRGSSAAGWSCAAQGGALLKIWRGRPRDDLL